MGDDHIETAAKAMADLHVFAAIRALCENSLVTKHAHEAERKIRAICNTETAKALRRYDVAVRRAAQGGSDAA